MEQNKIIFAHLFLGIFVIGIMLMAISFTEIILDKNQTILSISIYLITLSVSLSAISIKLNINYFEDLFTKSGLQNTEQLFGCTNFLWAMLLFTINLDNYIMNDFRVFEFSEFVNGIVFIGLLCVNIVVTLICFNIDYSVPIVYFKIDFGFFIILWIIVITFLLIIFSIIIVGLITNKLPLTAIIFTLFNLILINVLSGKLKYTTWTVSY